MNIANLTLTQKTDRHVFTVIQRGRGGTFQTFSNRQVLMQWIKNEGGICYIETAKGPILVDKYNAFARRLQIEPCINITIIPPGPNATASKYEIIKSPLIRQY